jgi:hypothetical protein
LPKHAQTLDDDLAGGCPLVHERLMGRREWDYSIAGGGTAGCVLAARLTERARATVLLPEAGCEYHSILKIPLVGMLQRAAYSWKCFTAQQTGMGQRRLSYPFGKVLGGSSELGAGRLRLPKRGCGELWFRTVVKRGQGCVPTHRRPCRICNP